MSKKSPIGFAIAELKPPQIGGHKIVTSNSNPPLSANPKALTSRPAKSPHTKGAETTRLIEGRFACSKLTLENPTVAHAMLRSSI